MDEDERLRVGTELMRLSGQLAYAGRVVVDGDEHWRYKGLGTVWDTARDLAKLQAEVRREFIEGAREVEDKMMDFEECFVL